MTLRLFHHDDPAERETEQLLPWYLNGSLDAGERANVEAHLAQCPRCRRHVEWLRELHEAVTADAPASEVASALSRAQIMIDEMQSGSHWRAIAARAMRGFRSAQPWLRWTLVGEAALILVLAVGLAVEPSEPALYRTLAAPEAERLRARTSLTIVFDGETRADDMRRLLAGIDARIVGGPTAAGAYLIEVASAIEQQAIRRLRADRAVRFVEPSLPAKETPR